MNLWRKLGFLAVALVLGLGLSQVLIGQGDACYKCCGNALYNEGTRGSNSCPYSTCYWLDCRASCVSCPGQGIDCGGTYSYNSDSCFVQKCPCDRDVLDSCRSGCSAGF